jgi:uncharacterized protein
LAEAALGVVALAVGALVHVPPFATLTWNLRGLAAGIAATAPLLLLLAWCLRTRFAPIARLLRTVQARAAPLFAGETAMAIALVATLAGVGEEALFRGVMQTALLTRLPAWAAVAVTAATFGLAHALTLTYAVLAALIGGYLGWLHIASGNLLVPILAHALYDFIALQLLLRVKPTPTSSVL